jgi:hypothetical protein
MSDVREIIDTSLGDAGVSACITAANSLIGTKSEMLSTLTSDVLRQIELWLAAHFVSVADPRVSEEATRETRVRYEQPKAGQGIAGSSYGQTAIALDSTLTLADAPATRRASFSVL